MANNLRGRLVTVNLNDDVLAALDALAKRRGLGRARSELLREAALDYCARELAEPTADDLQTSISIKEEASCV